MLRMGGGSARMGGGGAAGFGDIFGSMFGGGAPGGRRGGARRQTARRGQDLEVEVTLSFDQAMAGAEVPVTLERREACAMCSGSGARAGSSPRLCSACDGRGSVTHDVGGFSIPEESSTTRVRTAAVLAPASWSGEFVCVSPPGPKTAPASS